VTDLPFPPPHPPAPPPPPPPPPGASVAPGSADLVEPRWGVGDAIIGFVGAFVASAVVGVFLIVALGYADTKPLDQPLWLQMLLQLPLWAGLLGVPLWATSRKGNGPVRDLGLSARGSDIPLGIGVGLATQLFLLPLLYVPLLKLFNTSSDKLDDPGRQLSDRAHGTIGVLLLVVIVGLGAPIAEEIFYRGLLQRALIRRLPAWLAIGITAFVFAASHLELLQLPGLALFGIVAGILAHRTGRLGPSIVMHMTFNLIAVIALLQR
jgi:membrane protease YdiL (CAAX protease family)